MTVGQALNNLNTFNVGQRYTYLSKEICIQVAERARKQGFKVEYGTSITGRPYFEIKDPFTKD